jgi:hypothetical protein
MIDIDHFFDRTRPITASNTISFHGRSTDEFIELAKNCVCLGNAPVFRRIDVEQAVHISSLYRDNNADGPLDTP